MRNFDEFLDSYYEEIKNTIAKLEGKKYDYNEILEQVNRKFECGQTNYNKKHYNPDKSKVVNKQEEPLKKEDINYINEKLKQMNLGQGNIKEASTYARFYKYKVRTQAFRYADKTNYVFSMDNNFFKKLIGKPEDRFKMNTGAVEYHELSFIYTPKAPRKLIDDTVFNFEPFKVSVTTEGCHDMVYYHIPKNSSNSEILKGVYVLDIQKVIDKLMKIIDEETNLSDVAKINMTSSIHKHLGNKQSIEQYGVDGAEEYCGLTEEQAIMIVDDYEDDELLSELHEYVE